MKCLIDMVAKDNHVKFILVRIINQFINIEEASAASKTAFTTKAELQGIYICELSCLIQLPLLDNAIKMLVAELTFLMLLQKLLHFSPLLFTWFPPSRVFISIVRVPP